MMIIFVQGLKADCRLLAARPESFPPQTFAEMFEGILAGIFLPQVF
jgi:hypothetical protein